ncbi:hypothetical protein Q0F99_01630 [Rathayibacter oskolensis]|uniref:hypothetical protein n=1 Tax=Rathayibacter oskolensis TaxID=1891671 RepID=UPI00265FA1FD|nr:hypothetical protein [Rathayibacter oskolensis]WKK71879.1 hypothetical protein Q0F99_01630 [Rathayibacter oskolensis]
MPSADGLSVTLVTATPGYAEVVWPGDSLRRDMPRSAVAGVLLASRAGLDGPGTLAGLVVAGETLSAQIDQVAAASPRMSFLDRAVVIAEPASGTVVECLVEADDRALAGVEAIAVSWFPAEYETTTAPFDPTLGQERELDTRLAERLSAAGPFWGRCSARWGSARPGWLDAETSRCTAVSASRARASRSPSPSRPRCRRESVC